MQTRQSPQPPYSFNACLIGCGKMGGAMLDAWVRDNLLENILVIDPHPLDKRFQNLSSIRHETSVPATIPDLDIIILAVKPQILEQSVQSLIGNIPQNCAVLSIAAGLSLNTLSHFLGHDTPIIRCMPNTPAAIGKGMSVAVQGKNVTKDQSKAVETLLSSIGKMQWINDEEMMDSVTALSGSGPAYVFYMIEALAQAGENIGLSQQDAMTLARQTVIGSAALAEADNKTDAKTLRENVTSPNGTTQAGLEILMNGAFQDIITQTLKAAKKRSIELNN